MVKQKDCRNCVYSYIDVYDRGLIFDVYCYVCSTVRL